MNKAADFETTDVILCNKNQMTNPGVAFILFTFDLFLIITRQTFSRPMLYNTMQVLFM